jgi:hypothetical protein
VPNGVSTGVRCDGDPNWAKSGSCAYFATFSADAPVGAQVIIRQEWTNLCGRANYNLLFSHKITAGCAVDAVVLGQTITVSPTQSPAQWQTRQQIAQFPFDAQQQGYLSWSFVARKVGAAACGVSLDDFVWSGPGP